MPLENIEKNITEQSADRGKIKGLLHPDAEPSINPETIADSMSFIVDRIAEAGKIRDKESFLKSWIALGENPIYVAPLRKDEPVEPLHWDDDVNHVADGPANWAGVFLDKEDAELYAEHS